MNAAAIRLMAEKGLSAFDIAEIAEAAEVRKDPTAAERMARYRAKQKVGDDDATRNVTRSDEPPPPNEYISNPPPSPQSPKGDSPKKKRAARSDYYEIPAWVPTGPWAAFVAMRKAKKKPVDSYMAARHFAKLRKIADAGWNLEDVIDKATNGFWDGFWEPDGKDPSIRRANPDAKPQTDAERRASAQDHADRLERIGQGDAAAEIRRRWSTGPPRGVGELAAGLLKSAGRAG